MPLIAEFELTDAQVREVLDRPATGLFKGLQQKLMEKVLASASFQLTGANEVEFSEAGIKHTRNGITRGVVPWVEVASVNERPKAWVVQFKPTGVALVPRTTVADAQEFTARLRALAGAKYKVRPR
ncbi:hypothetical protein AB0K51_25820 [Kitasatospora sp. NPDC049285]|uniref:hypothetical protein n=1 Tax=Kitasatospora sp. NPDC049285 TaxID=3157096 RepID=UPI003425C258